MLHVCIYVAPWTREARHFIPLYVPTCSGMTIKLNLNLTWNAWFLMRRITNRENQCCHMHYLDDHGRKFAWTFFMMVGLHFCCVWISQVTIICIALFNNANCVKAALQYLDEEIVCRNSVILLWPDKISSLNLGCSRVRLCKGLIWFLWSCPDGRLRDMVFTGDQSLGLI